MEEVIITAGVALAMIILGYLLFRSIKKEEYHFHKDNISDVAGIVAKNDLIKRISELLLRSGKNSHFALFKITIDDFKTIINDNGKEAVDKILVNLADIIRKSLGKNTIIARFSDDEYVAWLSNFYTIDQLKVYAEDLMGYLSLPINIKKDVDVKPLYNIGVVSYPEHAKDMQELLKNLDTAVYISRKKSVDKVAIFDLEVLNQEQENAAYYAELKDAIKNNQFLLYYQPIVDTSTKKIFGFESLLRWNHPTLGVLSPFKFIDLMEKSGDILWVSLWGFEELVKTYVDWSSNIKNFDSILSINLSPSQLKSPTIVNDFRKILRKYKVDAKNFALEIVEFALFQKYDKTLDIIRQLKALGFNIAIDDLGLDYQTLTKLENLPINIIKLDKKFITESSEHYMNSKIAEMLVDFSLQHDMKVIAEAIDTSESVEMAKKMNIHIYQGYLFARPLSKEDAKKSLEENNYSEKITNIIDKNNI